MYHADNSSKTMQLKKTDGLDDRICHLAMLETLWWTAPKKGHTFNNFLRLLLLERSLSNGHKFTQDVY